MNLQENWLAVSADEVGKQQPKKEPDKIKLTIKEGPVKLTRNEEAEHAIRLLGQPTFRVFVYQWRGGIPDGWVQFDGPKAERKPLLSEQTVQALLKDAKNATPPSQSGMLVITIGIPDESKNGLQPCQVVVELQLERPTGDGKATSVNVLTSRSSGWVRDFASSTSKTSGLQIECEIQSKDSKKSKLFDFRIVSKE
jgi:hypothetical protein